MCTLKIRKNRPLTNREPSGNSCTPTVIQSLFSNLKSFFSQKRKHIRKRKPGSNQLMHSREYREDIKFYNKVCNIIQCDQMFKGKDKCKRTNSEFLACLWSSFPSLKVF